MIKVGLTGGIGSGKSLIAKVFKILGIPVFEADLASRAIFAGNPQIRQIIIDLFGENLYSDKELNRSALAAILFKDPKALDQINKLVHPLVIEEFNQWCGQQKDSPYVIHEAAILFETGYYGLLDRNILVVSPAETRISRILKRDNTTRENILARMDNQWPDERKIPLADHIINNDDKTPVLPVILQINKNLTLLSNGKIR